jgi:hypothetical protein
VKIYGGGEGQLHAFLTSTLYIGDRLASRHGRFIPGETASGTQWIRDSVGSRATLDAVKRKMSCPCRESNSGSYYISPYDRKMYVYEEVILHAV